MPQKNDRSESGCVVECPPLSHLQGMWRRAPISGLHLSLVARGKQDTVGCVLPRWVLLINIRNSTRGKEALNWSVISYMGFAKCLGLGNKQGTSGSASVEELPYDSRTPPRDAWGCAPSPRIVLCPTQSCTGTYAMAQLLLPAPGVPTAQTSLSSSLQLI